MTESLGGSVVGAGVVLCCIAGGLGRMALGLNRGTVTSDYGWTAHNTATSATVGSDLPHRATLQQCDVLRHMQMQQRLAIDTHSERQ